MAALKQMRLQTFAGVTQSAGTMLAAFAGTLAMLVSVVIGSAPVHAQSNCDVRDNLIAKLGTGYAERPVALGVASTGNVVELLISSDGTWTILVTRPNGTACVAAVGEDWQEIKPQRMTSRASPS